MKTVLLAVSGLSPQVLTETLYALHGQGVQVDEIRVITTRPGRDAIHASLLSRPDGHFHRYLEEYGHAPDAVSFPPENIRVVIDEGGAPLDDILDEEDNLALMNACLEEVFHLTARPDTTLIFSIAGGRKTMSACLLSAAVLYARPGDRVCHVLVSPEFENHRDFFYPPRVSVPLTLRDDAGTPFIKETRFARVHLVEVPFVSVRGLLAPEQLREPLGPAAVMDLLLHRRGPSHLVCDLAAGTLTWRGVTRAMTPARLALYALFLLRKRNLDCSKPTCRGCSDCYLEFGDIASRQDELSSLYSRVTAGARDTAAMSDTGILGLNAENFRSYKAKIRRDIQEAFGPDGERKLMIEGRGKRPDTRYGIPLDRDRIRVTL
ncbi:MAG TPA: CRISPR-associated ring nuclease Csm6 [Syntrophales bacterium]|nr:CRISPR-associated ring nuclease Csm6 [Syntrophales bacterium]HOM08475.1 CRISPR-associated ring nuclease Csm6 [Syntrophales bacterium]HOO00616.1 CRISPR-associated ring nuclease Csm6 [Syntrophales bacterium]HPC01561.1 CRISPR-associated ring nuclease Csm6 [Syntrophales bacterium]HRS87381.1 CRISPR-associated ring nuclease Csm6 [Syntrophales bacterium]